jgi:hypothetical protein
MSIKQGLSGGWENKPTKYCLKNGVRREKIRECNRMGKFDPSTLYAFMETSMKPLYELIYANIKKKYSHFCFSTSLLCFNGNVKANFGNSFFPS